MTDLDDVPLRSPCLKKCQLHPIDQICLGCFRRLEEIADWARFDNDERGRIIAELPARKVEWEKKQAGRRRWR